ncbi:MAG: sugar porter family MFS transporter [Terracidiphilus sp.]|nr:sugar porter family MFS transporter [Terracidiphilus sp.]
MTGALGGLLFGFDLVLVSGIIDSIVRVYGLSDYQKGLTVAMGPISTVIGCFVAGVIGQRLGTRTAMRWAAAVYLLATVGTALAVGWPMLLAMRFMAGLGLGSATVLCPVYIAELSPALWRGRLVGMFQINVVTGILVGYVSNYFVRLAQLGAIEWRVMVAVVLVPGSIFLLALFTIPRSPRWSASRNEIDEALLVLSQMGAPDPKAELDDIQSAIAAENASTHEAVFQWKYRYPLFLAISIGAFNQLAGINAIMVYVHDIFRAAGFSMISGDVQAIAIGLTNWIFCFVGMSLIDHFGRKSLLLVGAAGTFLCLSAVAWVFVSQTHQAALLPLLVTFIAFFSMSQGAVIWVYIGEVFPTSVRSKGQGVGSASHWIVYSILALIFPVLTHQYGAGAPFIIFAVATFIQFVVVLLFYPETKGKTLEQLQRQLVKG